MQITLNQVEIENAVRDYITNQGLTFGNGIPEVTLTTGRSPNGITASIDFSNMVIPATDITDLPVIPNRPEIDLKAFVPDPPKTDPKPKAVNKVESVKEVVPKSEPAPVAELVEEVPVDLVEEEEPVDEVTTDLFGSSNPAPAEDVPATDNLFAL